METTTSVARFSHVARRLGAATRAAGLVVPAFRTPPRVASANRTIRRLPGGPVVAVRIKGRSFAQVVGDLVDGVIVANCLDERTATRVRTSLLAALDLPGDARAA